MYLARCSPAPRDHRLMKSAASDIHDPFPPPRRSAQHRVRHLAPAEAISPCVWQMLFTNPDTDEAVF